MGHIMSKGLHKGETFTVDTDDVKDARPLRQGSAYVTTRNGYAISIIDYGYGARQGLYEMAWWPESSNEPTQYMGWLDGPQITAAIRAIAHGVTDPDCVGALVSEDTL